MKGDKYTKSRAKNQVSAIFHMRDIRGKYFTTIYEALYGDAILVSLMAARTDQQKHLSLSFPTNT